MLNQIPRLHPNFLCLSVTLLIASAAAMDAASPTLDQLAASPAGREPVVYTGSIQPEKTRTDGWLPHAVGVHHYQAFRANRTFPSEGGITGWTYNHQPYLAHWNGRFYLQYLSALFQEHEPPTRTLLMTSEDGRAWTNPIVVFPEYTLPAIEQEGISIPAGMIAVMHQRMSFYTAPNGRLLTLGFYGFCETPRHSPNAGNGIGRVVREIHADGSLGPVYFIRYNRHAGFNEQNTSLPFYRSSHDDGFIEACDALLADQLYTLQWWEEDRAEDGFYAIDPGQVAGADAFSATVVTSKGAGKAFAWYTRPDNVVVGLWKNQYAALSPDRGLSWTPIVMNKGLWTTGAKTWGQRTDDGRYVVVHNQSATRLNRFPMVAFTGDDGHRFDSLLCLQGEVPPRRFQGAHKGAGQHYFRGITEGNGNPPGDHLWVVYSMNKEDIWISRTTVPLTGQESHHLNEDFQTARSIADLERWNLHLPRWAPASVVTEPGTSNRVLELRDEDPYDHVLAERVFPASRKVTVSFRVQAREVAQGSALDIEVQSQRGDRPHRLRLDANWLGFDHEGVKVDPIRVTLQRWHTIALEFDCEQQTYSVRLDGRTVYAHLRLTGKTDTVERVVFRTGPFRGWVPLPHLDGEASPGGVSSEDLPGADHRVGPSTFWIDDLRTH
jgi:hypothetical protein